MDFNKKGKVSLNLKHSDILGFEDLVWRRRDSDDYWLFIFGIISANCTLFNFLLEFFIRVFFAFDGCNSLAKNFS